MDLSLFFCLCAFKCVWSVYTEKSQTKNGNINCFSSHKHITLNQRKSIHLYQNNKHFFPNPCYWLSQYCCVGLCLFQPLCIATKIHNEIIYGENHMIPWSLWGNNTGRLTFVWLPRFKENLYQHILQICEFLYNDLALNVFGFIYTVN